MTVTVLLRGAMRRVTMRAAAARRRPKTVLRS
jgi:hypothetical protein